jgi:hypothetical protein
LAHKVSPAIFPTSFNAKGTAPSNYRKTTNQPPATRPKSHEANHPPIHFLVVGGVSPPRAALLLSIVATAPACQTTAEAAAPTMDDDDDKKTKMKWWERSALVARTKGHTSAPAANAVEEEDKKAHGSFEGAAETLATAPGAVAVRGPGYRGEENGVDDGGNVRERGGRGGDGGIDVDDEEAFGTTPLQVDSYAVSEGPTDEEIRQQILSNVPRADAVTAPCDEPKTHPIRLTALLLSVGLDWHRCNRRSDGSSRGAFTTDQSKRSRAGGGRAGFAQVS